MDKAGAVEQHVDRGSSSASAAIASSIGHVEMAGRDQGLGERASLSSAMSVASTLAPSAAKASAVARPIPCAAAVTRARLPSSRPAMRFPRLTTLVGGEMCVAPRRLFPEEAGGVTTPVAGG